MIVEAPPRYAAALVTGLVREAGVETPRASVVIKADYDLEETAPNSFQLTQRAQPSDIVYTDQGERHQVDTEPDTRVTVFDVRYEADIAIEKSRADIVVEGHLSLAGEGAVLVDGAVWLRRGAGAGGDRDANRNLFGWQPRDRPARKPSTPLDFQPAPGAALPAEYTAAFNNVHRRGSPFTATASIAAALRPGAEIEIHHSADHSDPEPLRVRLTLASLRARYRAYCGHGPDIPHAWSITALDEPALDTLIVTPADGRAIALWRTGFYPARRDTGAFRAVQITEGGA